MNDQTENVWVMLFLLSPVFIPVAGLLVYAVACIAGEVMGEIKEEDRFFRQNERWRRETMERLNGRR